MTKIQNFKMFIDGEWVDSSSGKKIETLNPETNEVWATVPEANEKDVDKAVKAAQKAFDNSWSKLHPKERAKFLRTLVIN
jgi:aldehyde dehydrogenase (NAD+)/betaine-aldehyde dehydrogenase